jgi:hypothetical protein
MTKTGRIFGRLGYTMLVLVLASSAILLGYLNHDATRALASYRVMHPLSPDTCKTISEDLNSSDPARIARWAAYFQHAAEGKSDVSDGDLPIQHAINIQYQLYKSREQGNRSSAFRQLLLALMAKQESQGLKVSELTNYLGEPDVRSGSSTSESFEYGFRLSGTNFVVRIQSQADVVSGFEFGLRR